MAAAASTPVAAQAPPGAAGAASASAAPGDAGSGTGNSAEPVKPHKDSAVEATSCDPALQPGCVAGSFASNPLGQLASVLAERDATVRVQRLREALAVRGAAADDEGVEAFAAALERSSTACRRAALLYGGAGELAVSFNGGKDACVVLYLWLASVAVVAANGAAGQAGQLQQQTVIFFDSPGEFPAVRELVAWVVRSLGLRMVTLTDCDFKRGMEQLVASGIRAVVMGQRRGDPWMDKVELFSPSTDGWPVFMRINPIIDWSYSHVWMFLRAFGLPYSAMYDEGYTSIGNIGNTEKNPLLLRADGSYAPAYELTDASAERAGRAKKNGSTKAAETNGSAKAGVENSVAKPAAPAEASANGFPAEQASHSASSTPAPRTAGIAVVGNEILNGKVHDANAHYLCKQLHSRGVLVKQMEVVPDDVDAIARSVRSLSSRCDFVFTSGGLGPTHDDLTMAGVAAAFGEKLVQDKRFYSMLAGHATGQDAGVGGRADAVGRDQAAGFTRQFSGSSDLANQKMAAVPQTARLEWPDDGNPWPVVSMRNVYIFAGMPTVFRAMFERAARDGRFEGARRWLSCSLWLDAEETDVLEALQQTVEESPLVEIGSYPAIAEGRRRLNITLEAFDAAALRQARARLEDALPEGVLVAVEGAEAPPAT